MKYKTISLDRSHHQEFSKPLRLEFFLKNCWLSLVLNVGTTTKPKIFSVMVNL